MFDSQIRAIAGLIITGKLDEAIEHLTSAIVLNPLSAIMYGTRGKRQTFYAPYISNASAYA
jgi:hypothetical protein